MYSKKFTKILKMPPGTLMRKIYKKLNSEILNIISRKRDISSNTRIKKNVFITKNHFLRLDEYKLSILESQFGKYFTEMHLSHRFNLLGSDWVKVEYGMECSGFEDYRYDMSPKIYQFDKNGEWLKKIILNNHLHFSKKIWQMVDYDYAPIDWQLDFKSGYRWGAKTWYKNIKYGHILGVDVKVPWELARMQHLPQMAIFALNLSEHKNKLIREFRNQVLDFIATNPLRMGVNWACTMDVAIRVTNWLIAYNIICQIDNEQEILDEEFKQVFTNSAYEHGFHILNNLEWSKDLTSNHYLSNIASLLVLAVFTENVFEEAGKWKEFTVKELKKEMFKQVYPDGTDFEASTCYHRLVLELFFYSTFFAVQNEKYKIENEKKDLLSSADDYKTIAEDIFGKDYVARLYKMFDAVLYLLKPNGRMPQIGDNDNGQFIKLYPREVLDMRYLLALGAVFFKEPKWKIKEFFNSDEDIAEVMILYGEKGMKIWNSLEWNSLKNISSKAFSDSGWYVMRNNKDYCIISCGPNGQNGRGGHCHNDKLSFELCINGEDIIVDPGTYVYTPLPEWRNKFRSTAYHNTVIIDEKEQNNFYSHSIFALRNEIKCKCLIFEEDREKILFEGEYKKYIGRDIIECRRSVVFIKENSNLIIEDRICNNFKSIKMIIFLAPNTQFENLKIKTNSQYFIEEICHSPAYGIRKNTKKLVFSFKGKNRLELSILK